MRTCAALWVACSVACGGSQAVEAPIPDEDAVAQQLGEAINAGQQQNQRNGRTGKGLHHKGHGCLKGTFSAVAGRPDQARFGVLADERVWTAWVRFSNGFASHGDDNEGQPRGLAIKLLGVPGEKLTPDETATQDFVLVNHHIFTTRTAKDFLGLVEAGNKGTPFVLGFLLTHPRIATLSAAATQKSIGSMLAISYHSAAAYKLGPSDDTPTTPVKLRASPCNPVDAEKPKNASVDYLKTDLVDRMRGSEACFDVFAQFFVDVDTTPVEDATVPWKEEDAPAVRVAQLRLPAQSFDSEAQQLFCDRLSFTPWHSRKEHRPLGNINRARKRVYDMSFAFRREHNMEAALEPTGLETFP